MNEKLSVFNSSFIISHSSFPFHLFGLCPLLDTLSSASYIQNQVYADVAELADAQVSEACDGDIVEVRSLSSAFLLFSSHSKTACRSGKPSSHQTKI